MCRHDGDGHHHNFLHGPPRHQHAHEAKGDLVVASAKPASRASRSCSRPAGKHGRIGTARAVRALSPGEVRSELAVASQRRVLRRVAAVLVVGLVLMHEESSVFFICFA